MTDFPAQTDPTTAPDSADAQPSDVEPSEAQSSETNAGDATATATNGTDTYAHVGNGVYQSAGGTVNGTADRINERFHEVAGRAGNAISHATDEAGEPSHTAR